MNPQFILLSEMAKTNFMAILINKPPYKLNAIMHHTMWMMNMHVVIVWKCTTMSK